MAAPQDGAEFAHATGDVAGEPEPDAGSRAVGQEAFDGRRRRILLPRDSGEPRRAVCARSQDVLPDVWIPKPEYCGPVGQETGVVVALDAVACFLFTRAGRE